MPPGWGGGGSRSAGGARPNASSAPASDYMPVQVCKGNNSRVLLNVFRARPWIHGYNEKKHGANGGGGRIIWEMYRNGKRYKPSEAAGGAVEADTCLLNHFENDGCLVTKKGLYWSLRNYYEARGLDVSVAAAYLPVTFHVGQSEAEIAKDPARPGEHEWGRFVAAFEAQAEAVRVGKEESAAAAAAASTAEENGEGGGSGGGGSVPELHLPSIGIGTEGSGEGGGKKRPRKGKKKADELTNVWIVKPAALSNRGFGIQVVSEIQHVADMIEPASKRNRGGFIVQKYIERPLLIHGRKFDIRCYLLLVADPKTGLPHAYEYREGYIRTSSTRYSLSPRSRKNRMIHLTNDAVQNKGDNFGKYEAGNKLSYDGFQEYLTESSSAPVGWVRDTMAPRIHEVLTEVCKAVRPLINPKKRRKCFELLGVDFMVTEALELVLIEVNSNPCLEFSSPYLEQLIPSLIEDTMQVAVDRLFPPPAADAPCTRASAAAAGALRIATQANRFVPLELDE